MIPVEVARVVREFQRRLRVHFGSELHEVRLFGSYARGSAHEASDVDVLVLLDRLDYRRQRAVLDLAGDLFVETNLLLSPTVFETATYRQHVDQQRPLASEIERQGIGV
jgi:predicted nucleotidyltransferase